MNRKLKFFNIKNKNEVVGFNFEYLKLIFLAIILYNWFPILINLLSRNQVNILEIFILIQGNYLKYYEDSDISN